MSFSDIFKRGKRKKSGRENQGGALRGDTSVSETTSPEASIQSPSPRPRQSGTVSALVLRSFSQLQISPPAQRETPRTDRDAWPNLAAFLDILNRTPVFAPLAAAIDNLSWFVRAHENVVTAKDEYKVLITQLEGLFGDLCGHFSESTPSAMTTSMLNLTEAIQIELARVYDTRDRDAISGYMQAGYDLDKINECYRHIQGHLNRIILNSNLSMWRTLDKHATETRLDKLNMSTSARYDSADAHVVQRRECTPNTREQVLLELKAWKNNQDGEKVCWINGMAGTGKTTIVNTLCASLDDHHELGASFFCTRLLPECRNVKFILPTVAYQLARFSSPFRGALLQALESDPDVHTKVLRVQFRRMILEPLQVAANSLPSIVVVVLDALDECEDGGGVEQILEALLENASELPIKFLLSTRPEHHIRDKIAKSTRKAQLILHQLDEKIVKADIETYIRAELAFIPVGITQDQLEALVERAGALFIYAATVVRYIKDGNTVDRLAAVLKVPNSGRRLISTNQTQEIDQLYAAVLTSALDNHRLEPIEKDQMKLILHTVVCAQEPLTVDALAGLLSLTFTQVSNALKPLWSVLHLSETDPTHRVSTLHVSFSDFLLDSDRSKWFRCDPQAHNRKLAEVCSMRIARNIPQFNICNLESSYMLDEDVLDLDDRVKQNIPLDLLYACQYWAAHLSQSGKSDGQTAELDEFLTKRLLLWMEVLNLSKQVSRATGQIELAISWLKNTTGFDNTMVLARDALRFVTMFASSPVLRSTPHLYVSMLSSWPHYQPVSQSYTRKTMGLVTAKGIEMTDRQLSLLSLIPVGPEICSVSYSPTGAFFAAGTSASTVLIWDAVSCRLAIDPISAHTDWVRAIAVSPDGTQICSGSHDRTLRIWDPQSGRLIAGPLEGHTDRVCSLSYAPNGQYLASGSGDGTVRIWDTHSWSVKGDPLNKDGEPVASVVFSPDSTIIAAGSTSLIHLWDFPSRQMRGDSLEGHTNDLETLAFTPDGKYLISGSWDRTIRIWDVDTGQQVFGPLQEHLSEISSIAISHNGQLLVSAALDNTIRVWDTKDWSTRSVFRHTGLARSVKFSLDSSRIISGSVDGNIRVWEVPDALGEKPIAAQSEGHSGWVRSVAFLPASGGTHIVSGSNDMTVRMWDTQNGQPICDPLRGHKDWVTRVGISPDSNHIFSVSWDRMIHVWDAKTGQLESSIGPIETDGDSDAAYQELSPPAFSFNGRRVVCGSESGRIYMWENDKLVKELTGHSHAVYSVAFSPDGQSFVSGDDDGDLILWDVSSRESLHGPFRANSSRIYSVAFSPDGLLVASGSEDRTICMWDINTDSQVGDLLRGHTGNVRSVAFSPQGTQLVSGSQDMTIRLWDVTTGQSIAILEGHTDWVFSVAFSPDGARIVSGSADTTIRLWNTPMPVDDSRNEHTAELASTSEDSSAPIWTMDEDGWVRDKMCRLLLWVPPDLRSVLIRANNTIIISSEGRIELDFSDARIGDAWTTCYEPYPPVAMG